MLPMTDMRTVIHIIAGIIILKVEMCMTPMRMYHVGIVVNIITRHLYVDMVRRYSATTVTGMGTRPRTVLVIRGQARKIVPI